jgi:hypothetical protein
MTRPEWNRVVELLTRNWPHQLQPDAALEKYRTDLDGFPVEQVLAAIETWYRDGREWPPTGGQVLGRLADLTVDAPPFYAALRLIRETSRIRGRAMEDASQRQGFRIVDGPYEVLERDSPFVCAFVAALGGFSRAEVRDGFDEARLRGKYEDCLEEARRSLVYGGIEGAGLPGLERKQAPVPVELSLGDQLFERVAARRLEIESQAA